MTKPTRPIGSTAQERGKGGPGIQQQKAAAVEGKAEASNHQERRTGGSEPRATKQQVQCEPVNSTGDGTTEGTCLARPGQNHVCQKPASRGARHVESRVHRTLMTRAQGPTESLPTGEEQAEAPRAEQIECCKATYMSTTLILDPIKNDSTCLDHSIYALLDPKYPVFGGGPRRALVHALILRISRCLGFQNLLSNLIVAINPKA